MRAIVQRVKSASVSVAGKKVSAIRQGLLVFVGVGSADRDTDAGYLAEKVARLRLFPDNQDKMNLSLCDTGYSALVVSQFTLYGDCRKGRRPSFSEAAPPAAAQQLYKLFVSRLESYGIAVATGIFQEMMDVELVNDGPVTFLLDSRRIF